MNEELAETGALEPNLKQIALGLEQFLKFEHADAYSNKSIWEKELNEDLPQKGCGLEAMLKILTETVIPNGSPVTNPGFSAFITTGATTASALASTAAHIAAPQRYLGTAFNYLEELSLQWLTEMFSIPQFKGVYSSGGSVANLVALGAARQYCFENIGVDPAADGINRQVAIYASEDCHHTIQRSAGVLGMGRKSVKIIACDPHGKIDLKILETTLQQDIQQNILPMAIVANAGSTDTGAIDPIKALAKIAKQHHIWFHVDGAYGLPGILDPRISHLYEGIEEADSIIVDPHKWLGASIGIAATFVKDREILKRAFTQEAADYLEGSAVDANDENELIEHSLDDFGIPYFDYGVELSAPCRGVIVWAMLKEIGVEGMRKRIIRHNDMALYIADFCEKHPNLEVLNPPTLSICCFRYIDDRIKDLDQLNQKLLRQLIRENVYMPSATKVEDKFAIRPCYVGARTEMKHAEGMMQSILAIGAKLVEDFNA